MIGLIRKKRINYDGFSCFIDDDLNHCIRKISKATPGDYLICSFARGYELKQLSVRSVEMVIKKYFPDFSYNDLKKSYFLSLLGDLPEIGIVFNHNKSNIERLEDMFIEL